MNLICPVCKTKLTQIDRSFSCVNHHHFDIAKSGYLNLFLTNNNKIHGDNKEMIQARTSFLNMDYYLPLKERIVNEIKKIKPQSLVDLACGEGYYTKDLPAINKVGIDLSKDAIQYASKHDSSTQYIVSSIFDCPILEHSIDCMTTIFAPIAIEEIQRCLKKEGHFFCVFPAEDHLYQLKEKLYDTPYKNEKPQRLEQLSLVEEIRITSTIHLKDTKNIQSLFMMTPYYFKTSQTDKEKINNLHQLDVTIDFYLMHYQSL